MRELFEDDPSIVTWAWTSVEIHSALERGERLADIAEREGLRPMPAPGEA